jgi:hypothetical protein
MLRSKLRIAMPVALAAAATGCNITMVRSTPDEPEATRFPVEYFPVAGDCRVWIPDDRPREQAPPGPCYELVWYVPPGGWLVRTPHATERPVEVWEFGRRRSYGDDRPPVETILYLSRQTGEIVGRERATYDGPGYYNLSSQGVAAAGDAD